jgi:hypothetical protein
VDVAPVGEQRACGFWDAQDGRGGVYDRLEARYPADDGRGAALRRERVASGLSLGEGARALGLAVATLSAVERAAGKAIGSQVEHDAAVTVLRAAGAALGRPWRAPVEPTRLLEAVRLVLRGES